MTMRAQRGEAGGQKGKKKDGHEDYRESEGRA